MADSVDTQIEIRNNQPRDCNVLSRAWNPSHADPNNMTPHMVFAYDLSLGRSAPGCLTRRSISVLDYLNSQSE